VALDHLIDIWPCAVPQGPRKVSLGFPHQPDRYPTSNLAPPPAQAGYLRPVGCLPIDLADIAGDNGRSKPEAGG